MYDNKGSKMKKLFKNILLGIVIGAIFGNVYLCRENYKAVTSIIQSQGLMIQLQTYFNEINCDRNKLLEEKVDQKLDKVEDNKPSFEYLKSVTVRILNVIDEESGQASVGTGSIIKVTEDYTYILTNKHVAPIDSTLLYVKKDGKKYCLTILITIKI